MSTELIVVIVLLFFALDFALIAFVVQRARQVEQVARERYPDALVSVRASLFGVESRGVMQVRGTGRLVIAPDGVHFIQWLPQREINIPAGSITGLDTPTWFLGKTQGVPLFKVAFVNAEGQADSAGWRVPDLEAGKRAVESILPAD